MYSSRKGRPSAAGVRQFDPRLAGVSSRRRPWPRTPSFAGYRLRAVDQELSAGSRKPPGVPEEAVETRQGPHRTETVHEHEHGVESRLPPVAEIGAHDGRGAARLQQAGERRGALEGDDRPFLRLKARWCAAPRRPRGRARAPGTGRARNARSRASDSRSGRRTRPETPRPRPGCCGAGVPRRCPRLHGRAARSRRGPAPVPDRDTHRVSAMARPRVSTVGRQQPRGGAFVQAPDPDRLHTPPVAGAEFDRRAREAESPGEKPHQGPVRGAIPRAGRRRGPAARRRAHPRLPCDPRGVARGSSGGLRQGPGSTSSAPTHGLEHRAAGVAVVLGGRSLTAEGGEGAGIIRAAERARDR